MFHLIFPPASEVEGIKSVPPVYVCVCMCVSVSQRSDDWTVLATDLKFGRDIAFDIRARILTKRACRGRARQRSDVFIWSC